MEKSPQWDTEFTQVPGYFTILEHYKPFTVPNHGLHITCNRCGVHFDSNIKFSEMVKHLNTAHGDLFNYFLKSKARFA